MTDETSTISVNLSQTQGEALSFRLLWSSAFSLLALSLCSNADAEIVSHTEVSYFTVAGNTPAEIYHNILDRGPRVGGARALASIGTRATQDAELDQEDGSCKLRDYVITLEFSIQRPRIANEQVLPPADRAAWQQMNGFIEEHENQHKAVWQSCAADLDHRIAELTAPSCSELGTRAEALWQDMLAKCDETQRSFDLQQSLALMRQPFMLRALEAAN